RRSSVEGAHRARCHPREHSRREQCPVATCGTLPRRPDNSKPPRPHTPASRENFERRIESPPRPLQSGFYCASKRTLIARGYVHTGKRTRTEAPPPSRLLIEITPACSSTIL